MLHPPIEVNRLPLDRLWREGEFIDAERGPTLNKPELGELLRQGSVQFVVASIGRPLSWIPIDECYEYWKQDIQGHLADPNGAYLDDFPGGYCYFVSKWRTNETRAIVLLEMQH